MLRNPSLRTILALALLAIGGLAGLTTGAFGIWTIGTEVRGAQQAEVNHDLTILRAEYERRLAELTRRVQGIAQSLDLEEAGLGARLQDARAAAGLDVLNVVRPDGTPLAGGHFEGSGDVPVGADPVLRRAVAGEVASGTVRLSAARLRAEGGPAHARSLAIPGDATRPGVDDALYRWVAVPLRDAAGRVRAVVYGGRAVNLDFALVDELNRLLFADETYAGKPRGTVTFFLGDVRVATNVRDEAGRRAVGTRVSEEVRRRVLDEALVWQDRALVVDAFYLSAYQPLRDPDGRVVGVLYVGVLEAPFRDLQRTLVGRLLLVLVPVALLALLLAAWLRRSEELTRPCSPELTHLGADFPRGPRRDSGVARMA